MASAENYWDDWRRGDWERAHAGISAEIEKKPDHAPAFYNRGICRLQMRRLEDAFADFQAAERLSPKTDTFLTMIGVVQWWLGRPGEAIAAWQLGLNAAYTDPAGGVVLPALLLFASVRNSDLSLAKQARDRLKKRWRTKRAKEIWPGPIAGLLLGHLGVDQFLGLRPFSNQVMDSRRACQAHFWAGVQRLRADDKDGYLASLREAVSDVDPHHSVAVRLEAEYWLATAELTLFTGGDHRGLA